MNTFIKEAAMPKIILNLRDRILENARTLLEREGYNGLAMRRVAASCNIALGTVYNYFPSKDMLAGAMIAQDWFKVLERMDLDIRNTTDVHDGLCAVADGLEKFQAAHAEIWKQYGSTSGSGYSYPERHAVLVDALAKRISDVLKAGKCEDEKTVCTLLAEAMISLSSHANHYSDHSEILERMIRRQEK